MAINFDPYRRWLGIPEGLRPPTHYQLLGIARHEADAEVINAAVIRQSAYVRNFQTGPYADAATRILGEIAAAKACLADPARRQAYDAGLPRTEPPPLHVEAPPPAPPSAAPVAHTAPHATAGAAWHVAGPPDSQDYRQGNHRRPPAPPITAWGATPPPIWAQPPTVGSQRAIPVWVWAVGAFGSCTVVALVVALVLVLQSRDPQLAAPAVSSAAVPREAAPSAAAVSPQRVGSSGSAAPEGGAAASSPTPEEAPSTPVAAPATPPAEVAATSPPAGAAATAAGGRPIRFDESQVEIQRFTDIGWGLQSLAFSPDGGRLVAGTTDRAIALFDAVRGKRLAYVEDLEPLGQVTSCAFTPDGGRLLTGGYSGRVVVWDVDAAGGLRQAGQFSDHAKEIKCLSVSPDNRCALSGSADKSLRYWELGTLRAIYNWPDEFQRDLQDCRILADGTALATDAVAAIQVDLATGETIRTIAMGGYARLAAISPDGRYLARDDSYDIEIWDLERGERVAMIDNDEINWSFAFAPDNSYLVSGGRGHINVWDLASRQRILAVDTGTVFYTYPLAISPDGRHIAAYPQAAGQDLIVVRLPSPTW